MISMIKWQCHSCYYHYCYYYHFSLLLLSLFVLSLLISWCAVLMNAPGLRDPVVMRVLSDCYWTAATGAGLFTSNSAHRHADHCVQAARADSAENDIRWHEYQSALSADCWSIRSWKYPWCSDLSLCGKNENTFCAANLQVVTRSDNVVAFLAET